MGVELSGNRLGQVKYAGNINGKKGNFYGVELWKGDGKHSGTYKGREYFKCINKGNGCFVNAKAILFILDVPNNYDPFIQLKNRQTAEKKKKNTKKSKQRISSKTKTSKLKSPKQQKQTKQRHSSIQPKYGGNAKQIKASISNKQKQAVLDDQNVRDASNQTMSVKEFKSISLKSCLGKGDNFDIAKRISKFYDDLFNDTDTVCLVSNSEIEPKYAISAESGYKRTESYGKEGKFVLVYRATPHLKATVIVKKQCFKSVVKGLAIDNENVYDVLDQLNALFGDGCHVVRCKKISFDIYSRFSDGYECELRLPNSGDYVLAWRR